MEVHKPEAKASVEKKTSPSKTSKHAKQSKSGGDPLGASRHYSLYWNDGVGTIVDTGNVFFRYGC